MKKWKKSLLSLFVVVTMVISMFSAFVVVNAEYVDGETLYSNDLESGTTLHQGCTAIVADPTGGTNNCAKYTASWYGAGLDLSKKVSSGIIQIKFDYLTQASGSSFHLNLAGSERSGKNLLTLIRRNGTVMEGAAGNYGTFEINKWYTVDTIINFDTKQYITKITETATGTVKSEKDVVLTATTAEYTGWPAEINEFTMLFFSGGAKDLEFLDNISVKTLTEKPEEKVLYSNDVESGALHAGGTTKVTDPTDSTNNCAKYNGGWYGTGLDLSKKVSSGIVQVKFDYMTKATGSSFHFDLAGSERSGKNLLTLIRRNGDVMEGAAGRYGTFETDKWYTIDTVINFDTKHYMTLVKDKATGSVIVSKDVTLAKSNDEYSGWPAEINEFTMLFFSGGTSEDYLDNVFVTTLLEEPAPLPVEKVLYSNDVESGALHTGGTTTVTDPTDSTNNYAKYNGGYYGAGLDLSEPLKSGIAQVKFDYMTKATEGSFHFNLAGSERSGKNLLTLIRRSGTIMEGAAGIYGAFETEKWYTIEVVINFDTKHYMTVIRDKATGFVINSVEATLEKSTDEYSGWPATIDEFTMLFFSGGSADEYLDNVLVKTLLEEPELPTPNVPEEPTPEPDKNILYSNDFGKTSSTDNYIINTDTDGNKYLTIKARWWALQYKFEEVTKNKIKVKFDFMNTADGSSFYAALADSSVSTSDPAEQLVLIRDESKMECYSSTQNRNILGEHIDNEWLTYEAVIDMNTNNCISTVSRKATGEEIAKVEVTLNATADNLADWPKTATAFDTFLIQTGRVEGTHIDNLVIEKVVDAPTVSASRITIKDSLGEVQNVWTNVSPSAKTFYIDFATEINEETVSEDTVYITEKDSQTPLTATVECVDGVAVLTLADGQLKQKKEYVLHISKNVANTIDETLGEDATYNFTVSAGKVSAVMGVPFVGETSNPSFASINANDVVKVPVTYLNTTGENKAVKFIVAYYKNNGTTLADVEFVDVPFSKDVMNAQYTFEHTFKNVTDADSLKVMIWSGFDTLVPMAETVEIN